MTDKRLDMLAERLVVSPDQLKNPAIAAVANDPKKEVVVKSADVTEEKPSAGLSKEKKSEVVKKAKKGEDIGKKGKGFEKLADKAAKEYGSKEKGEKVAAAAMWKNIKNEEVKEELKGNQTKIDKNHNGKIDAQDFKILKGQKKEVKEELKGNQTKLDKTSIVTGKQIGRAHV